MSRTAAETEQLEVLIQAHASIRAEISSLVGQTAFVGAVAAGGPLSLLSLADKWIVPFVPLLALILGGWAYLVFYILLKDGLYAAILERRINRLLGIRVLDWNTLWSSARGSERASASRLEAFARLRGEVRIIFGRAGNAIRGGIQPPPSLPIAVRPPTRLGGAAATGALLGAFSLVFFVSAYDGLTVIAASAWSVWSWPYVVVCGLLALVFGVGVFASRDGLWEQYLEWQSFYGLESMPPLIQGELARRTDPLAPGSADSVNQSGM